MEYLTYILICLISSGAVFAAAYFVLKTYIESGQKLELLKLNSGHKKSVLPMRLQAYERMTLYLERINPTALLYRVRKEKMSANELHLALLNTVRTEYDHNCVQQIYINEHSWEAVKKAKENVLALINKSAQTVPPKADGIDLAKGIIAQLSRMKSSQVPTAEALRILKVDIGKYF